MTAVSRGDSVDADRRVFQIREMDRNKEALCVHRKKQGCV